MKPLFVKFCRRTASLVVGAGVAMTAPGAAASPVTLDFSSGVYSSPGCDSYSQDGFTVATVIPPSGGGHTDGCTEVATGIFGNPNGNIMLSFHNHNPTGGVAPLRITFGAGTLDVHSVDIPVLDIFGGSGNPQGFRFTSSSGATQTVAAGVTGTITFGAGFSNISFLQFQIAVSGLPLLEHALDSFVVTGHPFEGAPAPGALALFGLGLLGLGATRRRMR